MLTVCALASIAAAAFVGNIAAEDLLRDLNSRRSRWPQIWAGVLFLFCSGSVGITSLYALACLWVW